MIQNTTVEPSNSFDLLPGTTVGQTFIAQHSGLTGIEFALEPDPRLTTTLILHLRTSPLPVTDLLSTTVLISPSDEASLQRFTFPADFQTYAQYYCAYLEFLGPGKITVVTGNLYTYRDGVLYDEGIPQEQQTVFGLVYDPFLIVADLLLLVLRWGVYGVLISTILFFWELTTILLTLVIPVAVIIGVGGAAGWDWLCRHKLVGLQAALVGVFLIGMGIGIRSALPIIYSGTRYLRTGDLEAMSWIREHTPQDAYFAVDGFSFSWSPGWIVGIDAGYWVPLLTMRQAVPPLMIYSMEWRNSPTALSELGASQAILELTATGQWDTLPEILRQYRVNYVLLDSRYSALPSRILEQVSGLQVVYRQDTIWVFEALPFQGSGLNQKRLVNQ